MGAARSRRATARRRQHRHGSPTVVVAGLAGDQGLLNESVHPPGQAASGEEQPAGQLRHPQRHPGGLGQVHQDLVLAQGQPDPVSQLVIQALPHPALDRQQPAPQLLLGISQPLNGLHYHSVRAYRSELSQPVATAITCDDPSSRRGPDQVL